MTSIVHEHPGQASAVLATPAPAGTPAWKFLLPIAVAAAIALVPPPEGLAPDGGRWAKRPEGRSRAGQPAACASAAAAAFIDRRSRPLSSASMTLTRMTCPSFT